MTDPFTGPGSGYEPNANPLADVAKAGASAGAASGAAAAGLAFWPWGVVIIGVSLIGAMLLRGKRKSPPREAQGIRLAQPVDGNAPMLAILGQPWFNPPLALQYAMPDAVWPNGRKASRKNRTVRILHSGIGQNHCADTRLRVGGTDLFSAVTLDSKPEMVELTAIGTDRRRWGFGYGNIDPTTVLIYFDDTLRHVGDAEAGHDPADVVSETVAATVCEPRIFQKSAGLFSSSALGDSDMGTFDVRLGCILPKAGEIDVESMKAEVLFKDATSGRLDGSGTSFVLKKLVTLKQADIGLAHTDDARQYLWARVSVANRSLQQLFTQGIVTGFRVAYSMKPKVFVDIVKNAAGNWEAVFAEPVPSSVTKVKATSKIADKVTVDDGFRFDVLPGTPDQDPVGESSGGRFFGKSTSTRATVKVGLKLDQYAKRRHSTTTEVDELVLGVEAGPRGFNAIDTDGQPNGAVRRLQIRLKETAAADAPATTRNDPSTGWVQLLDPDSQTDTFRLEDKFTGPGTWFFSCAGLLDYTKDRKAKADAGGWLPTRSYDVEIVAIDPANSDNQGILREDRWFSDLWFQHATEVRRVGFVLPRVSNIALETGEDFDSAGLVECRLAGRLSIVPAADATLGADGLPTPRTVEYTRNPVWLACNWLVDPIGGAGRRFTWSHILAYLSEARAAAAYCDGTETLRDGTTFVRAMCDLAIGEDGQRDTCGNWLARIFAGSGIFPFFDSGWRWAIDQDSACAQDPYAGGDFTIVEEEDCVPGAVQMEQVGADDVPSELLVEFRDGENYGARTTEPIQLDDPQPSRREAERVDFPAITRRVQAVWAGTRLLRQMRGNGTVPLRSFACPGTFGRGLRMMQLVPGDLVRFTSTRLGVTALKCRVMKRGWVSALRPALVLVEHVPSAYSAAAQVSVSAAAPSTKQATDETPTVTKLAVTKVQDWSASLTVGGKA